MSIALNTLIAGPAALVLVAGLSGTAHAAPPPDWSEVPATSVTLFYPGQSTYDWLLSKDHRKGNRKTAAGGACVTCHEDDEEDMGDYLVGEAEKEPIPGKSGSIELAVQAAHDAEFLYMRFQWKTDGDREGRMHSYMRYDGEGWKFYGSHRTSKKVRSGDQPPLYEDRLAIMIDDGSVPLFDKQGCWLTCHDGMRDTVGEAGKAAVKSHPLFGGKLGKSDIRKYLASTRTDDAASWDKTKSVEEIAAIKAAGGFLDLMQWRAARSNPVGMADDGYVLEYRLSDAGKGPYGWNVDKKTMTPKYMFDEAKLGFRALVAGDIGDAKKPAALIREANAVPYKADAGWKKGDILPGRLLSRDDARGSAADNDWAEGVWADGRYTVVLRRRLDTGHPEDDKILEPGGVYTVSFAVHDDNVTTRFHHVGFPLSLGIGVEADIEAVAVK